MLLKFLVLAMLANFFVVLNQAQVTTEKPKDVKENETATKGSDEEKDEDAENHQAVHQYRSVCNADGTCTYIFTLTVPSKLGVPLPQGMESLGGTMNVDSPHMEEVQKKLTDLHNTLYNLTTANHEETMMLTNNVNDMQSNLQKVKYKVTEMDTKAQMLNDGYASLRNNVGQIEDKVVKSSRTLDTKLEKVKAEMSQVDGELKSMEEYFDMYKDGETENNIRNYVYVIKVMEPIEKAPIAVGTDCATLYKSGMKKSGVYTVKPDPTINGTKFDVYCDMETDGGGWSVVQRREDGSENFDRNWKDYKNGFGDLRNEFWLGLEKMHVLSERGSNVIRFDLWDFQDKYRYARYLKFKLFGEDDRYRIQVGRYNGTAGDAFHYGNRYLRHNNVQFSTRDNDNDRYGRSCPNMYSSGWWFHNCMVANLNGLYYEGGEYKSHRKDGIMWQPWHYEDSLKMTEIKVRPMDFLQKADES